MATIQDMQAFVLVVKRLRNEIQELKERIAVLEAEPRKIVYGGGPRSFSGLVGTIANSQTPNTLLLDGSRKAELIDIDAGAGTYDKIIFGRARILVHRGIDGYIYFFYPDESTPASLVMGASYATTFRPATTSLQFLTGAGATKSIVWVGHDGSVNTECARLLNTGDVPQLQINRAGDIIGVADKTIDMPLYKVGGVAGVDGSFTAGSGETVTVSKGLITSIV